MKRLLFLSSLILATNTFSKEFLPEAILQLNDYFSHHIIVAEKATHSLYLYQNDNGKPKLVKKYQMATGKKAGDKIYQGDFRTPEGIYYFNEFIPHEDLLKRLGKTGEIYGVGAFVLNYPNPMDRYEKKTGGGIWLHSTNDETRIDKGLDSRGCLVAHNQNLIKISNYIELNKTNIVVVHNLKFLNESAWSTQKDNIKSTVAGWLKAWSEENHKDYISHYGKEFKDPRKGSLAHYSNYKRAVFNNPGKPEISISNLTILKAQDYVTVTFKQDYNSNTIQDTGKKTLYLKKDEFYNWKIVAERWTKDGIDNHDQVAFEPSMRFFNSVDPKQIFTKNINITQKLEQSNN